jgi:nanoRNase/pAp phosphatase (c-di-AMP/oligoRNAs hydrolase)
LCEFDLRNEDIIYAGNRFMVYALFSECLVSMHVLWGVKQQNPVFAIGKSMLDRSSPVDVGALCLTTGGGGHVAAGTCQIDNDGAEDVKAELIETLTSAAQTGAPAEVRD